MQFFVLCKYELGISNGIVDRCFRLRKLPLVGCFDRYKKEKRKAIELTWERVPGGTTGETDRFRFEPRIVQEGEQELVICASVHSGLYT